MQQPDFTQLKKKVVVKIAISSFVIQFLALYSSEIFNGLYNVQLNALGLSLVERLPHFFKPTIMGVFLAAYLFQLTVMFVTLRPMFQYLQTGERYGQARVAAIKLPWRLMLIQSGSWILGVTAYYILMQWQPESGLPYPISLSLKLAVGFVGTMYNCIVANIHLLPIKRAMRIVDIRPGEYDRFTRNKNLLVVFASALLIGTHFIYFGWFVISSAGASLTMLPGLIAWIAYFMLVSLGLMFISRYEYHQQLAFLKQHISRLLDASVNTREDKVQLLYFDEVGEFAALFNRFMDKFHGLLTGMTGSALLLSNSVQDLSTTTKEVTSTSNMQAAAVKEVVSTMEDSNQITQSIGRTITEVTRIAIKTKEHVEDGTGLVQDTSQKMSEIRKKNTDTISGIRLLTDKIRAIWDIVDIINTIVEQTRIIAFNAALEASTAGEAGRNFQIVAGEIKRLADSTSQSTAEIQARITEIQKAANSLIIVSEEGTERIRQGHELSEQLHAVFSSILDSADISASSSENIEFSIRQQASAFEQILVTMKEISRGIDNLVLTQQQTAQTAEALAGMAVSLKGQAAQFAVGAGEAEATHEKH
ncbi:MAG: hypothetical protein A2087_12640 [Spirochaetes bacterium GWD1_61_31]|nr:MAG: hypothetical protein A2Y37_11370 [Spirochaetes bacterium GWB1_60_80]OHD32988.1 MAG: hypothetical protein A2004_07260 [Spirochaetes bacterium GWC1_61_12]OHD38364.1 MAG: hypothetical protein A2087_12640 [Spirochaetes bacterium GWD1_61_31]OHD43369.1 MAG: hypothetical protein A2Y35_02140 [Spirochaetes bacterium GWE1_60_18]OHD58900.1 MAG: hypothetical protein A2Y32_10580 [Spirochaetes bacterium GWF1_60_12]